VGARLPHVSGDASDVRKIRDWTGAGNIRCHALISDVLGSRGKTVKDQVQCLSADALAQPVLVERVSFSRFWEWCP